MVLAKHLAFERGRTAVILRKPEPVSEANLIFIDERRTKVDLAIIKLQKNMSSLPGRVRGSFLEEWPEIVALRKQVDTEKFLPLKKRNPAFVQNWVKQATQFLEQCLRYTEKISHHFRQAGKASRLVELSSIALKSRLTAGLEASIIAQQVASKKPMLPSQALRLYQMYGKNKEIWAEVQHISNDHATPKIRAQFARVNKAWIRFRNIQENTLDTWIRQRPTTTSLKQLASASRPVLDGISELMILATEEARKHAESQMSAARKALMAQIFFALVILLVMALSIYYVMKKVVKPIEEVDADLRRLNLSSTNTTNNHTNEIERLKETAQILEATFSQKNQLEEELNKLAFYDVLTELPNRRLMMDRLRQKILRAQRNQEHMALLFIDLDEFKPVNDAFGHEAGDWLLKEASKRIAACVRASDTAARMGGDKFVVLLPDLKRSDDALVVAEKIRQALEAPFIRDAEQTMKISSSIGIATFPDNGSTEDDLLGASNRAMYTAKNTGRNKVAAA